MDGGTDAEALINALDLTELTRTPRKLQMYRREVYVREGLRDVSAALAAGSVSILHRHALLMVKPDGIAAGKVRRVLDFVEDRGFAVVGVQRPRFSGLLWREMWRYQLTSATLDRLALNDLIYVGAGLLLLLRDERPGPTPATCRLAALKGSADLSRQQPGTLRALLGQHDRNFSFIHVADEPADLVRELGLLLTRESRLDALAGLTLRGPRVADTARLDDVLAAESAAVTHRSFAAGEAADRVAAALDRCDGAGATALIDRMRLGEPVGLVEVIAAVVASGAAVDRWDLAALGASLIVCDEPGEEKLIPNPDPGLWG